MSDHGHGVIFVGHFVKVTGLSVIIILQNDIVMIMNYECDMFVISHSLVFLIPAYL